MPKTASTYRLPERTLAQLDVLRLWTNQNKTEIVAEAISLLYSMKIGDKSACNTPAIQPEDKPTAIKT